MTFAEIEKILNAAGYNYYTAVSVGVRPDGRYAIAIMAHDDPDFPSVWVVDLRDNSVKQLEPEKGHEIIDWPGSQITWPRNDFTPVAFDHINCFTEFEISLENLTFRWLGSIKRDDSEIRSDEWWIEANPGDSIVWKRFRVYTDNTAQLFYDSPQGARYDYFLNCNQARKEMHWRHVPIVIDDSGVPSTGRAELKDSARRIDAILSANQILAPRGDDDEALSTQLRQKIE